MLRGKNEILDWRVRSIEVRKRTRTSQAIAKEWWKCRVGIQRCPGNCWSAQRGFSLETLVSEWSQLNAKEAPLMQWGGRDAVKVTVLPHQNEARSGEKERRNRIWEKEEPREIKAENYIWIRCYSEWVTQKNEEENERSEMSGHCYKIWNNQKHSPGWTVLLNFHSKNYTLCRIRVCSSKMTAFCYTSRMVFGRYVMGCIAVQPQV